VSHQVLIDLGEEGRYRRPLARTAEFLDGLDAAATPVPPDRRVLAALGPRMLELARGRAGGTHPYLVTPELTARARAGVGPDRLVSPELGVVVDSDPGRARGLARHHLSAYLALPNYSYNWRRAGFGDDDLADGGSNRLVDALVAWGDEATIAARVAEHRAAGADHVCIQVLTESPTELPRELWRRLAPALT
jgi:probable F420-dependent oxidoreductase